MLNGQNLLLTENGILKGVNKWVNYRLSMAPELLQPLRMTELK